MMEIITTPSDPKNLSKSSSRIDLNIPNLSLEILQSKQVSSPYSAPIRELLLHSPSPLRKSRTRLAEKLEFGDDGGDINNGVRKRYKPRNVGSPRGVRRSRKRVDQDLREERDFVVGEEIAKPRKKRQSGRSKKDKHGLEGSSIPSKANDDEGCNLERIGKVVNDLIMWKDVSKSSLWFGFGSICFLSSCFAKGVKFSIFSMVSQLGLLLLVVSFFSNSVCQREKTSPSTRKLKLTEDDIVKLGRLILPAS
ncbi:hypothetical protein Leryth_009988 [Lithospermum erythrorhizon]|nr:hypothetical protein Leryth_009988 [Lithospermum erythrorhizon]